MLSTASNHSDLPPVLRVLLVEDSVLIRGILRKLLSRIKCCVLAGEESTAVGAIASCQRLRPEIVLLDLQLERGTGLEVLQVLSASYPETRVFVLTNYVEDIFRERCIAGGAYRFYDKSRELGNLLSDLEALTPQ